MLGRDFFKSYFNVLDKIKLYWKYYGGFYELIRSPYLGFALVLTLLTWNRLDSWDSLVIDIVPNILGFTLGGYAILLAFGDEKFLEFLINRDDDEEASYFIGLSTAFIHFIIVQTLAILTALIKKAFLLFSILNLLGVFLLYYSIFTALAAAFAIFGLFRIFHKFYQSKKK